MSCESKPNSDYQALIAAGEFSQARKSIQNLLDTDQSLTPVEKLDLAFQLERMDRIEKDFTQTEDQVLAYIRETIPTAGPTDLKGWEKSKALEFWMINGEKRYFNHAGRNLFRIDPTAKAIWTDKHPDTTLTPGSGAKLDLDKLDNSIIQATRETGLRYVKPVRLRIEQSIDVPAGTVPAGETLRGWIPYPRHINNRQVNIHLLKAKPARFIISPNEQFLQRTIYFQQPALADRPTHFEVSYEYTAYGVFAPVSTGEVKPLTRTPELAPYLREEPPHIVFTQELRELSERLLQSEDNPYRKAQILFQWVDENLPWASAREYSSIHNISSYAYVNRHGDCGIQTLLFITLCRMNGIPARWQSGWEFKPPHNSMHDWGMVYFEPYGWVPMDVTYGLRKSTNIMLHWFYLSGLDSYRLIFNDGFSQPFFPAKIFPRSETVDSQRGEVEWRGGNLYFDQWSWDLQWKVLETS